MTREELAWELRSACIRSDATCAAFTDWELFDQEFYLYQADRIIALYSGLPKKEAGNE